MKTDHDGVATVVERSATGGTVSLQPIKRRTMLRSHPNDPPVRFVKIAALKKEITSALRERARLGDQVDAVVRKYNSGKRSSKPQTLRILKSDYRLFGPGAPISGIWYDEMAIEHIRREKEAGFVHCIGTKAGPAFVENSLARIRGEEILREYDRWMDNNRCLYENLRVSETLAAFEQCKANSSAFARKIHGLHSHTLEGLKMKAHALFEMRGGEGMTDFEYQESECIFSEGDRNIILSIVRDLLSLDGSESRIRTQMRGNETHQSRRRIQVEPQTSA